MENLRTSLLNILLSSMYEVSESSLDEMISNNDEFIIYFIGNIAVIVQLAANILNDYLINNQD